MSSIFGFRTKAINEEILWGKEERGCQWQACKAPLEFCENAKFWESRPDSARSAEIPQNPGKCKSSRAVLHKSNTATNFFILRHSFCERSGRLPGNHKVEKNQGEKNLVRPITIEQPIFFTRPSLEGQQPLHFDFLGWFLWMWQKIWGHFPEFSISSRRKWFDSCWDGMWLVFLAREGKVMRIWKATLLQLPTALLDVYIFLACNHPFSFRDGLVPWINLRLGSIYPHPNP